jgi:hypothetical protein
MSKKLLVGAENNIVYFAAEWCFYIFAAKFSSYGNNYWQSPKQTVHLTMITTYGIAPGIHSGVVQKSVTMDDLFRS